MIRGMAIIAALFLAIPAQAKHHHYQHHTKAIQMAQDCVPDNSGRTVCQGQVLQALGPSRVKRPRVAYDGNTSIIGGRPSGCPHAYCGCGLRKYLGLDDKRLDLAWNWARLFPRTSAHAGAAAVRSHHVMLLVAHVEGSIWTVRDYNGGQHLSYIHERDVRGYVFVNPGGRLAGI